MGISWRDWDAIGESGHSILQDQVIVALESQQGMKQAPHLYCNLQTQRLLAVVRLGHHLIWLVVASKAVDPLKALGWNGRGTMKCLCSNQSTVHVLCQQFSSSLASSSSCVLYGA